MARKPRQRVLTTSDIRDKMFPGRRATIAPLYQQKNTGKVVLAVPGVLAEPYEAFGKLVDTTKNTAPQDRFGKDYARKVAGPALEVTGAIGTGGVLSPKPTGAIGTFGGKVITGGSVERAVDNAGYYSAALEAARGLKQGKGTPEQMRAQLRSAGMTEGEAAATNLDRFLEGKKSVTKQELVEHLSANRVGVNVVKRTPYRTYKNREEASQKIYNQPYHELNENQSMTIEDVINKDWDQPLATFQRYSLDPSNPSYGETVLHLPQKTDGWEVVHSPKDKGYIIRNKETGEVKSDTVGGVTKPLVWGSKAYADRVLTEDAAPPLFAGAHFPEPNIVGHYQHSIVTDPQGRKLLNLDQVQSDWGQRIRDAGGVANEEKVAKLTKEYAEAIAERDNLKEVYESLPSGPREVFREAYKKLRNAGDVAERIGGELRAAKQAPAGHPLVNTTDQWLNTTLRHALKSAVAAGAEGISVPKGKTVLGYNPGDTHGMETFYNQIVPKNLGKIIGKYDPSASKPHELFAVRSPVDNKWQDGLKGGLAGNLPYEAIAKAKGEPAFTTFYLTQKVKDEVAKGQPLFARGLPPGATAGSKDGDSDTYERTYKTGPKAGKTEVVRKAK